MTDIKARMLPKKATILPVASNLTDVIAAIDADPDISNTRKRDLRSVVRRICALLNLNPDTTPASMRLVRDGLDHVNWREAGITKKTFQTIRSNAQAAIARYAMLSLPTCGTALSKEWRALWDAVDEDATRYRLSRFMSFCSVLRISPSAVNESVTDRYLAWLVDGTLVKNPAIQHRKALLSWNRAAETVPGWPRTFLPIPSNKKHYCLVWEELPEGLRRDAEAWLDCLAHADPLSDRGPPRPVKPRTVEHRRFQIRQLVSALHLRGRDVFGLSSLADLVEVETAKEALRFFLERNNGRTSSQIASLATVLCAIAKHWVETGQAHLTALDKMRGNLACAGSGLTEKNRRRLLQFADRDNLERFLTLPIRTYDGMRKKNRLNVKDARTVKVVLALELLLMMPIRRVNLVELSLERHMARTRKGAATRVRVFTIDYEVKNSVPVDCSLPPETISLLNRYLERCRPLLGDPHSEWLFPGEHPDRPSNADQFSRQFTKTIRELTGLQVNMHLMRHLGAKLYLDRNPGAYELVRRVLGHKSLSTTVNRYTGLETEAAIRHFDTVILGIRNGILQETKRSNDGFAS